MKANCNFTAKLVTASEVLAKVDAKSKDKIQETYLQEQLRKQSKRVKQHAGTIQKMLETGAPASDIQDMLDQLSNLMEQDEDNQDLNLISSDDEQSIDDE